ncbi:MAG: SpoIID/LytB domain-containing protein, partial [Cyanobacteria bacterium]|nr:SpoIID/LytB domain-containing protein [Cyanobacteriota bacterium]MDW8203204.1 SpoIID/LytB domain-containing protein [Cyanobacteriota bacterium SKYGB_h_bin112]
RDVYNTPLLRRLLVQSVKNQGADTVRIETNVKSALLKASIVVNGFRYTRDRVEITAGKQVIQVDQHTDEHVQRLYPGKLEIQPNAYGTYTLVNHVPLEAYLRGVVPHEIGLAAPPATIEAQAILARTYALRNLRRFAIDDYELCADTQCQVYWGLKGAHPKTDRAIAATRGLVLTFRNELVDALYSSTTGGVTASFTDVWNGSPRPYLRAVVDAVNPVWDLANRPLSNEQNFRAFIKLRQGFNEVGWHNFRWQATGYLPDVNAFLKRYLQSIGSPHANFTTIRQLRVTERAASGRVQRITVTTDRSSFDLHKDNILNALYEPNSLLFHVDPLYGADKTLRGFVFTGGGLGHGVGLSQTGSYRLGELGWSSDRILSFYFPGTQLQPINPTIVFWRDPFSTPELTP